MAKSNVRRSLFLGHRWLVTTCLFGLLLSGYFSAAQTSVVLSPVPQLQFFDQSGRVLSFGCVFSYQSRTVTPLATYTDATGSIQNANPVPLSAGGSGNIWLAAGSAYTLVVKAAGGTNCSLGTTQYSIDGIGGGSAQLTTVVTPVGGSASFTVQAQNQLFTLTLIANTVGQPLSAVGLVAPAFITFQITEDGVGAHTFSWPANTIGGAPININAGQTSTQTFIWNGTNATAVGTATIGNGPSVSGGNYTASGIFIGPVFQSSTASSALAGAFRMASGDALAWRNNANGADLLFSKNTLDNLVWPVGLSLGGGTALATTNQSGTGNICMATGCTITNGVFITPNLGVATATSLACAIVSKTSAYTLTTSDCIIQASAAGGGFTLLIPHVASGQLWTITRTDASANLLTVAGDTGNINTVASITVAPRASIVCHADGVSSFCTPSAPSTTIDFSQGGCTPASSTDSFCTGTFTVSPAFVDATYIPQLTINSINGAGLTVSVSGSLGASSIPYTISCTYNCGTVVAPTVYVHASHQ